MTDYTYITINEVRHVCENLSLPDWTQLKNGKIATAEADIIRNIVGSEALDIPLEQFQHGLEIELEHGLQFSDANVTNNHPVLTGRIVLAHLKEGLHYYLRLECMELEMELDKAITKQEVDKSVALRTDLAECRVKLETVIANARA